MRETLVRAKSVACDGFGLPAQRNITHMVIAELGLRIRIDTKAEWMISHSPRSAESLRYQQRFLERKAEQQGCENSDV
jgi:hypothetical protein